MSPGIIKKKRFFDRLKLMLPTEIYEWPKKYIAYNRARISID